MSPKAVRRRDPEDNSRRNKRLFLFGCLGLAGLLIVILIVIALKINSGPDLPADIQRRIESAADSGKKAAGTPTAPGGRSPEAAIPAGTPPLRQQLARVEYASRSGDTSPQTLYVTDSELNSLLADSDSSGGKVREARAYFGDGGAYLVADVDYNGRVLTVTVATEPVIVNGGLQFAVKNVSIGSLSAPDAIVERVQRTIASNSSRFAPERTGLYVENVEIRDGVAILSGRSVRKR